MRSLYLTITSAALVAAGVLAPAEGAAGAGELAQIAQIRDEAAALGAPRGSANVARVKQDGDNNAVVVAQRGHGNRAHVEMEGDGNGPARVTQHGRHNAARVTAIGDHNLFTVDQYGGHNATFLRQERSGRAHVGRNVAHIDQRGHGNVVGALQQATRPGINDLDVMQNGVLNLAASVQKGGGHSATVTQNNGGNVALTGQFGRDNTILPITQNGGSIARVTQVGRGLVSPAINQPADGFLIVRQQSPVSP